MSKDMEKQVHVIMIIILELENEQFNRTVALPWKKTPTASLNKYVAVW